MLNLPNAITLTRIALVVVFTAAVSIADQYSWGYLAALVTFILAACTALTGAFAVALKKSARKRKEKRVHY